LLGHAGDAIIDSMAQLLVRDLDDELVAALRKRAAKHGRSVEAEHREILKSALRKRPARDLKEMLLAIPRSESDEDEADFSFARDLARDVDLG
jgi:antitoxin FitA